jgi:hypothetical protein
MKPLWLDLLQSLPGTITAITATIGVWIAVQGLNRWRFETVGKRRAELAEEVLALFYEAYDAIIWSRYPHDLFADGANRGRKKDEDSVDKTRLDSYYAVVVRLQRKEELFAKLWAAQYRFIAHFGQDATRHFMEIRIIREEIFEAVRWLLIHSQAHTHERGLKETKEKLRIIFMPEKGYKLVEQESDPIEERLDRVLTEIEAVCSPIISQSINRR